MDHDGIVSTISDSIIYHNIPMPPAHGRESFIAAIEPMFAISKEIKWEASLIAETKSGEVLTERTDTFRLKSGKLISMRVMGVFEWTKGGELFRWRDYFDLAEFEMQVATQAPG